MTDQKDFKRLVRQRAATTGERYTEARQALLGPSPEPASPLSDRAAAWLALLDVPGKSVAAFDNLKALPEPELRHAALAAITSASWKVRRACCRLLDDLAVTAETMAALQAAMDDEHPRVRAAALHSLSCEKCKPDGCTLDIRGVFERGARDRDAEVRGEVIGRLAWGSSDEWAVELMRRFAAEDPSAKLRRYAERGLARIAEQERTDALRKELPEKLLATTERHPGKWVAIADGRIIGAAPFRGSLRRVIKGHRATEAKVFWVAPSES